MQHAPATPAAATRARVLGADAAGIQTAAELLRGGRLVAFPTETVYGLGANALDESAVRDIFRVKGRPLTDPLIVHVPTAADATKLLLLDDDSAAVVEALGRAFWPGPLTLVAPAGPSLPPVVCAGTGFVGVRCPAHDVARALLTAAAVPVAAPSANRFGHVSPTRAAHVLDDLGAHEIAVLDAPGCAVGIESTVAKVDVAAREVLILRRGGVSERALADALAGSPAAFRVRVLERKAEGAGARPMSQPVSAPEGVAQLAPGQLLTHYAPDRPTLLAARRGRAAGPAAAADGGGARRADGAVAEAAVGLGAVGAQLRACAVLDFGGALADTRAVARAYRDLSESGNVREAAHSLFDALRWAEGVDGASHVLLADLAELGVEHEDAGALFDRMFRAASGRHVRVLDADVQSESQ